MVAFDPVGAEAAASVVFVQMVLLISVAAAIVISIQAVGVVLVVALLITPAAAGSPLRSVLFPDVHGGGHWPSIGSHGFVYILLSCSSTGCYSSGGCHQYLCRSLAGDEGTRLGTEEEEEEQ